MASSAITVVRELPVGVELAADLTDPLSDAGQQELLALYRAHHLILLRDQQALTPEDHKRVGSYLGPVPEETEDDRAVHMIAKDGALGAGELVFHSDLSFDPDPYQAVSLLAREIDPPEQTSTSFVDAAAAYGRLSDDLRARIAGRTTVHIFPVDTATRSVDEERPVEFPSCEHPIVMQHPDTGEPLLYITFQASRDVSGLDPAEGEALLAELFEVLYDPAYVYEHPWRPGDLIFWDNRAVQHARGNQSEMRARTMQRLVLARQTVNQRYHDFFERSGPYLARVSKR